MPFSQVTSSEHDPLNIAFKSDNERKGSTSQQKYLSQTHVLERRRNGVAFVSPQIQRRNRIDRQESGRVRGKEIRRLIVRIETFRYILAATVLPAP